MLNHSRPGSGETRTYDPRDETPRHHASFVGRSALGWGHISLRRLLRDKLKRLYFAFYKLGVRLGAYILPTHDYVSEPNIIELERTIEELREC